MVELFASRRRAEAFARALEGGTHAADPRLEPLLATASRLAAVPLVQPRAEFRDSLRERLVQAAAVELPRPASTETDTQTAPSHRGPIVDDRRAVRGRRRLVAAATGLVLIGAGTGVAAASEQALPGDTLYPVKRTLESARVSLARGADSEGRALLGRAATRLDEAEALTAQPALEPVEVDGVESALDDFSADASAGGAHLLDAYAASGDPDDLRAIRAFAVESRDTLRQLSRRLPPQAQPAATAAAETVVAIDGMAVQACPDCAPGRPPLTLPTELLALPDLGADGSPNAPGSEPLPPTDHPARHEDQAGHHGSQVQGGERGSPGGSVSGPTDQGSTAPRLPGVHLQAPLGGPQPQDDASAAPGQGGGVDARRPRLDLGGLLGDQAQNPQQKQQSGLPGLGDLPGTGDLTGGLAVDGGLTEPLSTPQKPVKPLLDRTRDTLGGGDDGGGDGDGGDGDGGLIGLP